MRLFCEMTHWFGFPDNPIIASPFFFTTTVCNELHGLVECLGIALADTGKKGLIRWSVGEICVSSQSESVFDARIQVRFMSDEDFKTYTLALQVRPSEAFHLVGQPSPEYILRIEDGHALDELPEIFKRLTQPF